MRQGLASLLVAFTITGGLSLSVSVLAAQEFDPRDLSGYWEGDLYAYSVTVPGFTRAGQVKFNANSPSYGRLLGSPEAAASDAHIGRRRAVPPALGNDPVGDCNPLGLMRLLLYSPSPIEIIQTQDKMLQVFEWSWDLREIWTDGRDLPENVADEYLPRFNGYSVGNWEGDTFVVETVGFDDRQWVDHFGYPISPDARLEERWIRVAADRIEMTMTLTDPAIYTTPWESDTVTFTPYPEERLTFGGWTALVADRCVPEDEIFFNTTARDPAGGIVNN